VATAAISASLDGGTSSQTKKSGVEGVDARINPLATLGGGDERILQHRIPIEPIDPLLQCHSQLESLIELRLHPPKVEPLATRTLRRQHHRLLNRGKAVEEPASSDRIFLGVDADMLGEVTLETSGFRL
jgi:hypothetical protein